MANGLYAVLSKYSNDPLVGLEENKDRKIVSFPVEWLFVEPGNKKMLIVLQADILAGSEDRMRNICFVPLDEADNLQGCATVVADFMLENVFNDLTKCDKVFGRKTVLTDDDYILINTAVESDGLDGSQYTNQLFSLVAEYRTAVKVAAFNNLSSVKVDVSRYNNEVLKDFIARAASKGMNVEVEETAEQKVLIIRPSIQYVNW